MAVTDSFTDIFDKCPMLEAHDEWQVQEENSQASFKKLVIQDQGRTFHAMHKDTYKNMACITTNKSSFLEDRDCDGVALTEKDGQASLFLSELKSAFDSSDILKAYKQIVFTYLKLHMMMSICEGFDTSGWEVTGIIACLPPKNKAQMDIFCLECLNQEEMKPDLKLLSRLWFEKKVACTMGKTPFTKGKPLHDKLGSLKITIRLHTAHSVTDQEATLKL